MHVTFFTIVLDGMPFIKRIYPELRKLDFPWTWVVIEGVARPSHCTKWCATIPAGLSTDGTTEYLAEIDELDSRVIWRGSPAWDGKVAMVNQACAVAQSGLLWQIDSDEFWTAEQIQKMVRLFRDNPSRDCAYFWCRYFVGPDIVITSRDTYGNFSSYEWLRVWRFEPGQRFLTHEPPRLERSQKAPFVHAEIEALGLVFDHHAYATEKQVAFKERYYGSEANPNGWKYKGAVANWRRLQANTQWPVKELKEFLPWVGGGVVADRISG